MNARVVLFVLLLMAAARVNAQRCSSVPSSSVCKNVLDSSTSIVLNEVSPFIMCHTHSVLNEMSLAFTIKLSCTLIS